MLSSSFDIDDDNLIIVKAIAVGPRGHTAVRAKTYRPISQTWDTTSTACSA
jgi:hypothetical protein